MQIEKFSPHSNAQSPPVRRNDIIFYKIQTASYNLFQLGAWGFRSADDGRET